MIAFPAAADTSLRYRPVANEWRIAVDSPAVAAMKFNAILGRNPPDMFLQYTS
jgi:hypothetical protein